MVYYYTWWYENVWYLGESLNFPICPATKKKRRFWRMVKKKNFEKKSSRSFQSALSLAYVRFRFLEVLKSRVSQLF